MSKSRSRLGWLQTAIIATLWNKEMYGTEIQNHLKVRGFKIGPSQLYPTLHRLKKQDALSCREIKRSGTFVKLYRTTEVGKKWIFDDSIKLLGIFQDIIVDKFDFIPAIIQELLEIKDGRIYWRMGNIKI